MFCVRKASRFQPGQGRRTSLSLCALKQQARWQDPAPYAQLVLVTRNAYVFHYTNDCALLHWTEEMHRALYVAEIARLVCDNANQSSLVALARCCSALHQEAMAALWRKLDNLAPLVSTLPSDCWVIEKREQVNYSSSAPQSPELTFIRLSETYTSSPFRRLDYLREAGRPCSKPGPPLPTTFAL